MNAVADGYVFLSIDGGPVSSLPIQINTDKIVTEIIIGTEQHESACPSVRALLESILTTMRDQVPESQPNQH